MTRGLLSRNCASSSACSLPSSRSSKSPGLSALMTAPRASTAIASIETVWTVSTASRADPACAAWRIAPSIVWATTPAARMAPSAAGRDLRGDTEADELFPIARLDFEEVLPCRKSRERQVDLLNVGQRRRSDLQLAHGLTAPVEETRAEHRRRIARAVRRHADQQPIGPRELAHREGHGIG